MEIIAPHGGELKQLIKDANTSAKLKEEALELPSWDLTNPQLWDLELLLNGAFSPLDGYLSKADYESVCKDMRLADGTLWPMPINLQVSEAFGEAINEGDRVVLRHPEGMVLGILTVSDKWVPDKKTEADQVFGTTDESHPAVFHLFNEAGPVYLGGKVEGVELPQHHTYHQLRHTPAELRARFKRRGWDRVVAFQTRNPMHRVHIELAKRAAARAGANLLIHPVVGRTKPGDVDYFVRVRCYQAALKHFPEQTTMLSLLPLAMRMAGPREAVWHALIRKNYGCTHFIVGRDHAGCSDANGKPFYGPDDAANLVTELADDIGVELVTFDAIAYVEETGEYMPVSEIPEGAKTLSISGTELRRRLQKGLEIPEWFSYPDVVKELRKLNPPRSKQGFTVFFTGLSGAGKSTVANILVSKLMEEGSRPVTLLDGDIVRTNLSSELGFSKEHRDLNIQRIGFVASEITKNGGVAICAPIAPYEKVRKQVREMINEVGGFVLVHVSTPIEVCEERDRKGLYAKARAGIIKGFTGIDDPYEAPKDPEIDLDTSQLTAEEAANRVLLYLEAEGFINANGVE